MYERTHGGERAAKWWKSAAVRQQYQMTGSLGNEKGLCRQDKSPLDTKGTKIQRVWSKLECRNTLYCYFGGRQCMCSRWHYLLFFQVKWLLSFAVFKTLLCQWRSVPPSVVTDSSHSQTQAAARCFRCQRSSLRKDSSGGSGAARENSPRTKHQRKHCA